MPSVAVLEVIGIDPDGELLAKPAAEAQQAPDQAPIVLLPDAVRGRAPAIGDRVLARIGKRGEPHGQIIRILPRAPARVIGTVERVGERFAIRPVGAKARELELPAADAGGAQPGELVVAERIGTPALGPDRARVLERLGRPGDPRTVSLLAAHSLELRIAFPPELEDLRAADLTPWSTAGRADLRDLPLVTIDGADARDFDDAVAAAPDDDPANPGGWQVVVAIADVAHYVRPDDPVDREARLRGNSVYFPDRVLPMLPEVLSNDLCSLRPGAERPCVAVCMVFDRQGRKLRHRFQRAVMRSRARLTYAQVQAAADGAPDAASAPLLAPVIAAPLSRVRGPARGPPPARHPRSRSARDRDPARRRPAGRDRAPRPARFPPADRGVHDRRQRRRGGNSGAGPLALHVPGPRAARPGQARRLGAAVASSSASGAAGAIWRGRGTSRDCSSACAITSWRR